MNWDAPKLTGHEYRQMINTYMPFLQTLDYAKQLNEFTLNCDELCKCAVFIVDGGYAPKSKGGSYVSISVNFATEAGSPLVHVLRAKEELVYPPKQTNIAAELVAVIGALDFVINPLTSIWIFRPQTKEVHVLHDSQFSIDTTKILNGPAMTMSSHKEHLLPLQHLLRYQLHWLHRHNLTFQHFHIDNKVIKHILGH